MESIAVTSDSFVEPAALGQQLGRSFDHHDVVRQRKITLSDRVSVRRIS